MQEHLVPTTASSEARKLYGLFYVYKGYKNQRNVLKAWSWVTSVIIESVVFDKLMSLQVLSFEK